ncbi:POK9 protein, partial [Nyctiprogne leucopyga]|nr:POK9 protein [Nyctiprogne leucopyga]
QAKQTVAQYGLRSEAARQIIKYIVTADDMAPADESSQANRPLFQQRRPATRGSLGVDLETSIDVLLSNTQVTKTPTEAFGPLWNKNSTLGVIVVGRSSSRIKGLIVIPGVIDADYTGSIYVMAYMLNPPMVDPKGSRIAQLIALKNDNPCNYTQEEQGLVYDRGDKGFGSTGPAVCFTQFLNERPYHDIVLEWNSQSHKLEAMLDTGADVTIIDCHIWPKTLPTCYPPGSIAGVGG